MTTIRVRRSSPSEEVVEVTDLRELRELLAGWASAWDWPGTTITSESYGDTAIIRALPLEAEWQAATPEGDALDELYDRLSNDLELAAAEDRTLLAAAVVNGRQWVLVDQGDWFGRAWLPVPLGDDLVDVLYAVETRTDGGAYRSTDVYRVPGATVTVIVRDHFGSRTGDYQQVFLEPGEIDIDYRTIDLDPEGLVSDDDPVTSISLTSAALDAEESAALAQHFAARHGPRTCVQVNDCTIKAERSNSEEIV